MTGADDTARITWWVYAGDELIRRTASMRGLWDYEAMCSCGWHSKTGGATRRYIAEKVQDHKRWDHAR
jgi:hypothetical protein